jgi:hypothetical protein
MVYTKYIDNCLSVESGRGSHFVGTQQLLSTTAAEVIL